MDPSLDLLPTALFSPSKAAAQRAQAQEWHAIDTWLTAKYQGRSVPQFERNEDTLRALMALSRANERADEERDVISNVQKDALAELKAANGVKAVSLATQDSSSNATKDSILNGLVNSLPPDGKLALDALSTAATSLDVREPSTAAMASAITQKTVTAQGLAQQMLSLSQMQRSLEKELGNLRSQVAELRGPAFQAPLALQRQTLDWTRNTKQLKTKLNEYSDRLASLSGQAQGDVRELVEQEQRIHKLEQTGTNLMQQLEAYKGLPSNKDEAVDIVKKLEGEVAQLGKRVDAMFEGLVER
jgi:HAUS augmin-like complex subunit 1